MDSVSYNQFGSSDRESLHQIQSHASTKGRQNKVAYILYGILVLLLLILLMVTGIKLSQLSQSVEDVKTYLTAVKNAQFHLPFSFSPQTGDMDLDLPHQGACKDDWLEFEGHCYFLSEEKSDWHTADLRCRERWGQLFVPNDRREMEYISLAAPQELMYWIGLYEIGEEGNWTLVDGTDFKSTPTFWDTNQPDDWHVRKNGEDCVQLHPFLKNGLRRWNDADCTISYNYICEVEQKG